jgi:hypothetical protein
MSPRGGRCWQFRSWRQVAELLAHLAWWTRNANRNKSFAVTASTSIITFALPTSPSTHPSSTTRTSTAPVGIVYLQQLSHRLSRRRLFTVDGSRYLTATCTRPKDPSFCPSSGLEPLIRNTTHLDILLSNTPPRHLNFTFFFDAS